MTRPLVCVDSGEPDRVLDALRAALGGGPAVLPHPGAPTAVPATVPQRVAVVVETSGSTGRPKRVALSATALLASAAAAEGELGGPGQWLLAVPAHYIAGIALLVRSIAAQTQPVMMSPGSFTAERFVDAAARLQAPLRFTSLVPVQLARLIEGEEALPVLRRFDRILLGGQATPPALLERARKLGLNVTRTYGSSETCGGCIWDGLPLGDTQLALEDARIQLSGSVLAEGYLDDPQRTAAAFVERDGRRWYRSDDTGELVDGVLRVTGRVDDVIVSGGVKVSLAEVELVVRALPGLAEAVVVAAPHPQWGQTPVVVSTVRVSLGQLREAVAATLGRAAAPHRILLVETIPLLPSGKPDRLGLASLALK